MPKNRYKVPIRSFLLYLLTGIGFLTLQSQNVRVNGRAHPSYAGKEITLFTASDFITGTKQREDTDTVGTDGYFELQLHTEIIQPVFLKVGNAAAQLYVQPDFVYGITIPELEESKIINKDIELNVNIGVVGNDSTELNALIFDFQEQYNLLFLAAEERYLGRASMFKLVDSLGKICEKRYAHIRNDYFRSYVMYSLASLNASLSRGEEYLIRTYILGKPVQYGHFEYMQFFKACFKGYLDRIATRRKGQSLYNIINNKADYDALMNFVKYERNLTSDTLRELIILRNLWDYHFSTDFVPDAVTRIVSKLNSDSRIEENKKIARSMLMYFNKLQVGSQAPDFTATARDGKQMRLMAYKGRWIYLNFFSTTNIESLKEMPKISTIRRKYGDRLLFISVCLDDSISTYKKYLAENPRFDWPIWYVKNNSGKTDGKQAYAITGTEGYFFINNFGNLAQSPAIRPSKGFEYKANVIFKVKTRTTKTGIR